MKKRRSKTILPLLAALVIIVMLGVALTQCGNDEQLTSRQYLEIEYPTQNYSRSMNNEAQGIILHHTALPTIERSLEMLTLPKNIVSTHCVIDTDGTRYILAEPTIVTFHAGKSILNGREKCNEFTIGVEFQGNTVEKPLTDDQIRSAVEYLKPVMSQYKIPIENVVTHEFIRNNYLNAHPEDTRCKDKCDITRPEYERVIQALKSSSDP